MRPDLTAGPGGTLTAAVVPDPETDLGPGGTYSTPFTVTFADAHHGPVTLDAQLPAEGRTPLRSTGVTASGRLG